MYNNSSRRTGSNFRRQSPPRRNFGGRRPSRVKSLNVDESKFINKATTGNTVEEYKPNHKFADFNIDERLKANVLKKGFEKPTAIQDKSIPVILKGNDIIGLADTGTGKTAAFLLPLIDKVLKGKGEKVLILAPTRELALQINAEFIEFAKGLRMYSVCAVGGASISAQIREIRQGYNILIGTPGRVKDLVKRNYINLDNFRSVVLDEADRMLDMGFVVDMRFILGQLPQNRQTLFFSATLSREVENLTEEFLNNPIKIATKTRDTSSNVDQDVVKFKITDDKLDILHNLLVQEEFKKVLIFGQTKIGVEKLSSNLNHRGFKAESIHGNKTQSARQRALKQFKEEKVKILVATDVAARGLDIPEVTHVINFELPQTYEDYIHRIGRTGRGYNKGTALTFIEERMPKPVGAPQRSGRNFGNRFSNSRRFGR